MVTCKTIGEYKRNQEKIRKLLFEEARALKATSKPLATRCPQDISKYNSDANGIPGPSSIPTRSNANATKKDSEQKDSKQTKKKTSTTKNANTRTRWSRDKLIQIATENQKQQQRTAPKTPKGVSKVKTSIVHR